MDLHGWFKGFEAGIARLSPEQRSAFFAECGKSCVNGGTLGVYRQLHAEADGDMDAFFIKAGDLPGVSGEVVERGRVYHLCFLECTCALCRQGYVSTPLLCECSRQSVLYSLQCLWPGRRFSVTLCHSILQGAAECKMRIEVL